MKTKEEAKQIFEEWLNSDEVGELCVYKPPKSELVSIMFQEVLKSYEMDKTTAAHFDSFMKSIGCLRGEVFCNSNGEPDRIKYVRSYDD